MTRLPSSSALEKKPGVIDEQQRHLKTMIEAVACGDRLAFEALYKAASPHIFGFLLRILPHQHWAEEVLQECFIAVWQKQVRYVHDNCTPFAWLCAVANEKAICLIRTKQKEFRRVMANDKYGDVIGR